MNFPISRNMFPARRAWLSIFLCLAAFASAFAPQKIHAQTGVSKEYLVKAGCLFHFAQFVTWPAAAFADTNAPFRIGVLGENPFGGALDDFVKGETIADRKITVQYSRRARDLKDCQIVFVCKSEKSHLPGIFKELNGASSLTVGEDDGFIQAGGVINFYLEDGKVRFEIVPDAAARENLNVSSQLLRLAKIVKP